MGHHPHPKHFLTYRAADSDDPAAALFPSHNASCNLSERSPHIRVPDIPSHDSWHRDIPPQTQTARLPAALPSRSMPPECNPHHLGAHRSRSTAAILTSLFRTNRLRSSHDLS
ncbi:hypothetical protein M0802_015022 [Mischocyttarus mexicanus]|nr:hypothetical protein M0802_015022 [Mischocyttarus mexicanus]